MSIRVVYSEQADNDLQALDRKTAQRIYLKIQYYAAQKDPFLFAKKLRPPYQDFYRYRVGDYRAIFSVKGDGAIRLLAVLRIKHRKDVHD